MAETKFNFLSAKEAREKYTGRIDHTESFIRVRQTSLSVSLDIAERFGIQRLQGQYLDIQIDPLARAIKLEKASRSEGGSYFAYRTSSEKLPSAGIPSYMKRAGMPRGVYQPLPENQDVFIWQEPELSELPTEPSPVQHYSIDSLAVGDEVSWRSNQQMYSEKPGGLELCGTVLEITTRTGRGGKERFAARIRLNKESYDRGNYRMGTVTVDIENLTILKKGNTQDGK